MRGDWRRHARIISWRSGARMPVTAIDKYTHEK